MATWLISQLNTPTQIIGDLRHQSRFTELTADGVKTEIEDDWTLSTSLTRPSWGLETGSLIWMPYSELLYDSEYTPIEDENGVPSPNRQSDLSIRSGLSTRPWKFVRNIRLAGLANPDMAQLEDKPTEYAALAQLETKVVLRGGLIWSSNAEYLWYGKTQDDDLSDLRVRASGTVKSRTPILDWARFLFTEMHCSSKVAWLKPVNGVCIHHWTQH